MLGRQIHLELRYNLATANGLTGVNMGSDFGLGICKGGDQVLEAGRHLEERHAGAVAKLIEIK